MPRHGSKRKNPMGSTVERQFVRTVLVDMEYLRDKWDDSIDEESLRRNSTVLRRLLVEGDYGRAWRIVGLIHEPRMQSVEMDDYLFGAPAGQVLWAQRGGASRNGVLVLGMFVMQGVPSPEEIAALHEQAMATPTNIELQSRGIREYMAQQCMLVGGSASGARALAASRHQLVKYVSNKLGGAHLEPARNSQDREDRVFIALDSLFDDAARVADMEAVYFGLLSIGQNVARSDDATTFIERARSFLEQPSL